MYIKDMCPLMLTVCPAQVDYTMRTLAGKHLNAVRFELAAADVPGAPAAVA